MVQSLKDQIIQLNSELKKLFLRKSILVEISSGYYVIILKNYNIYFSNDFELLAPKLYINPEIFYNTIKDPFEVASEVLLLKDYLYDICNKSLNFIKNHEIPQESEILIGREIDLGDFIYFRDVKDYPIIRSSVQEQEIIISIY